MPELFRHHEGTHDMVAILAIFILLLVVITTARHPRMRLDFLEEPPENQVLSGVKGKALYLYQNGQKHMFPDYYTFTAMGFNQSSIRRMREDRIDSIPEGTRLKAIPAPPTFREEDWMFHAHCEDPPRLVNDLGVIANNGDIYLQRLLVEKVKKTKKLEILALGGSITAGGYFEGFLKLLREEEGIEVTIHNHGHGATDLTYTIFCIEMDHYSPDLVLIDFSVNDNDHPRVMEGLLRKAMTMGQRSKPPVVALVNFWVERACPTSRYLVHAQYYNLPLINMCPAVALCYGRDHLPKWRYSLYSTTDGVHPWGTRGVPFIGEVLHAWWKRLVSTVSSEEATISSLTHSDMSTSSSNSNSGGASSTRIRSLLAPLYGNHVGSCTRCDALADDADGSLQPVGTPSGFRVKTRVKVGFGGFNPHDNSTAGMTKSFKRSYQAETPGSSISFRFYGKEVKVALWQRRDGMGVLEAKIDDNPKLVTRATGFFKGYTWAMERNNTGRSEVVPLFTGLEDTLHTITFTVTEDAANPYVKGHTCQIFALLSASDNPQCKDKTEGRLVKTNP